MLYCKSCNLEYRAGKKFCQQCGAALAELAPVAQPEGQCLSCGHLATPGKKFCSKCGSRLAGSASPASTPDTTSESTHARVLETKPINYTPVDQASTQSQQSLGFIGFNSNTPEAAQVFDRRPLVSDNTLNLPGRFATTRESKLGTWAAGALAVLGILVGFVLLRDKWPDTINQSVGNAPAAAMPVPPAPRIPGSRDTPQPLDKVGTKGRPNPKAAELGALQPPDGGRQSDGSAGSPPKVVGEAKNFIDMLDQKPPSVSTTAGRSIGEAQPVDVPVWPGQSQEPLHVPGQPLRERGTAGRNEGVYRVGGGVSAPSILYRVEPAYTEEARNANREGVVVLSAIVRKSGAIEILKVVRSLGLGLDESAINALKQWKFRPGTKDGMPVDVALNVEVNFLLRSKEFRKD